MKMNLIGRKKEIKKLMRYASLEPENKAFFGVKGLGKSALIEHVFSKSNSKTIAAEYKYLFVRTILNCDKNGEELIDFLLDRVVNGVDLIEDLSEREEILERIKDNSSRFYSKESLLREALETVKEHEYIIILVMDEFHNLGRNTAVGTEQYDFLRSLNELGLVYYWVVSDSAFSDVYATSEFTTSFFTQKFMPETLPQMGKDELLELLIINSKKYDISLPEGFLDSIYEIIGGIPAFVVPALMTVSAMDGLPFDKDHFSEMLLEDAKCNSVLESWSRGLTEEQKDLLLEIARIKKVYQEEYRNKIGRINQLGDYSGLGLLVHGADSYGKNWSINTELFRLFILRKTELFYSIDFKTQKNVDSTVHQPITTYIQNNYYTVNNIFSADMALEALSKLKRIVSQHNTPLLNQQLIDTTVKQLPYQQPEWELLDKQQKDEKMNEFADKVFESADFRTDSLSENQMKRFYLTHNILNGLTENSRNNLISAIQVYDLLQFCIDKFGLSLSNCESARGILFARLYECILKENLTPALNSIENIASFHITVGKNFYQLKDAVPDKMTIGNYVYVLNDRQNQRFLADVCVNELDLLEYDEAWWRYHEKEMFKIGNLRNECCHSGTFFDSSKLNELLKCLFENGAIAVIEVYNAIVQR